MHKNKNRCPVQFQSDAINKIIVTRPWAILRKDSLQIIKFAYLYLNLALGTFRTTEKNDVMIVSNRG